MAYIYQITNDINGKIYIGKTERSVEERWQEHQRNRDKESCKNRPIYRAMNKYGIEHFHIETLEETNNPEERETYWIEQKRSFKYGYNATMGGDGKKYIDYDLVIATYSKLQNLSKTAQTLNICTDTVHDILVANKIPIKSSQEIIREVASVPVHMYNLQNEYIRTFSSSHEAARYMIENNLTACKHGTIRQHISEVCKGRRKTAAKFIWKY